jgi:polyribonucleotide nucleotidyltransferase
MGMIAEGGKVAILTDILGDEDALGDMDFKVTGTTAGIVGCQMDMKIDGLSYELLADALEQARKGRLHILNEMGKSIEQPNADLKSHAPRIVEVVIESSFIGAVIGPGGKVIQEIQRTTGTTINIEEKDGKGYINIFGTDKEAMDAALARITDITFDPKEGEEVNGTVDSVQDYGVFVKFGSKSGLLHVSEMSWTRIDNVEEAFKVGDPVRVKIVEIDSRTGKMRLSRKVLMDKPEGYVERPERPREERPRDDRGRGGDRRDDRRGGGGRDDRRGGGGDRKDRR